MGKSVSNVGLHRKMSDLINMLDEGYGGVLAMECDDSRLANSAASCFRNSCANKDMFGKVRGCMFYACNAEDKEKADERIERSILDDDFEVMDRVVEDDVGTRLYNVSDIVNRFFRSGDDIKEVTGMIDDNKKLRKSMTSAIRRNGLTGQVVCYVNSDRVFLSRGYEQSDCQEPAVISDPVDSDKVLESAQDLMYTALALKDNGCSDIAEELLTIINDLNRRVLDL